MARSAGVLSGLLVLTAVLASAGPARAADTCSTDTTVADFAAGSGSCYVAETADGELVLAPTEGSEFSGGTLPPGWGSFNWDGGGVVTVGSGAVTVDGAIARTDASYGPGRSLEFVATFTAGNFQHVGFGNISDVDDGNQIFNSLPWAIFSTKNDGAQVRARVWSTGGGMVDFDFGFACSNGTCLGAPHLYRIDWTATGVDFSIDGGPVHHENAVITGNMRPAVSDAVSGDGAVLSADWLRMTPYGPTCQFQSRIFDGGNAGADWSTLTASLGLPSGTTATIETRTGNTPSVDGTWSAFAPLSGTTIASPTARYLQYQVTLSTSDPGQTPELDDAQVCFTACNPVPEVCNGLDDDCDGQIDQTFTDLGSACTAGVGDCEASGVKVCSPDQTSTVCNVTPGTPHPETCDGHDNDCDGQTDNGDPGGNVSCSTGNPGICAAGLTHCQSGSIVCVQQNQPTAETCNGLDDNCNGQTDEGDPGSGAACNTGLQGVCAAGIRHCQGGALACVQQNQPTAETCNGLDDNCNGSVDEGNPGGGAACGTGQLGACAAGTQQCQGGQLACVRNTGPTTEVCNGIDDDCDGQTDEGNPGGGAACTTGQQGVCSPGTQQCQSGHLACVRNTGPSAEICNGIDDDCDGTVDDGDPGGGASCTTGMAGVCGPGTKHCISGNVTCQPNASSTPEVCNNLDDNCNGQVDEGNPGGGGACGTGELGVCAAGTLQCQSGAFACVRTTGPAAEVCNSGADEDCDGQTDELADCVLCQPASTVTSVFQTKKTKVRLKATPANDKVQSQGTFLLPAPGTIAPDTQDVSLRLTDNLGFYYQATIPAGSFVSSGNGRNFKFTDKTGAHDGILSAKFSVKGDGVTVKYTIKSGRLDEPAFNAGTGTATIQVGTRCFADPHDVCTVSGNGSSALCK